ncbi:MAG: hypothetical protein M3Q10_02170 [Chloroflexota bacterium]|nr:hypothetical protein [Chloroflexota bacterium]
MHWIRRREGFSRGPDRDTPRTYIVLGLTFVGLITAGVLIGVADESAAPVLVDATPSAILDAPASPAITVDATATP